MIHRTMQDVLLSFVFIRFSDSSFFSLCSLRSLCPLRYVFNPLWNGQWWGRVRDHWLVIAMVLWPCMGRQERTWNRVSLRD